MKRGAALLICVLALMCVVGAREARAQGPCMHQVCDEHGCVWVPDADGTPCDDGNPCTQVDYCQSGACVGSSPVICQPADQCHLAGVCNTVDGSCSSPLVPDGTSCNDGDACTQVDYCQEGVCIGTDPVICEAEDQCHLAGTCDHSSGYCSNPMVPDGTPCNDGFNCTVDDACTEGVCSGSPKTCDDGNPCTQDVCDESDGGCIHTNQPDETACDDGNPCTSNDACETGTCVGTPTGCGQTVIAPQAPATCITPVHPCVEVPVTIGDRQDATPLRGFSVTVLLAGELVLCPPAIVEGSYLRSIGATSFQTINNGGGSYTVDCAILGLPCGATVPSGTLFSLSLGSGIPSGTGTVTVTAVTLRDCSNQPVAGYAGAPLSIAIDNQVPGAVVLSATQQKSGNDGDGSTKINLTWTSTVTAGDSVLIYRAGYGHYPEYDQGGAVPATPGYPPAAPWVPAGYMLGPGASLTDEVTSRDFWYYVAFVKDPCGNLSGVSNQTGGTLNYILGDVSDGVTSCQGNNRVAGEDISFLGGHYGATLADPDALGCLDVGPTTTGSVDSRPLTDDKLNFEDLILFAINYGQVSAPQAAAAPVAAGSSELSFDAPARVGAGETFAVTLHLQTTGGIQGLSTQLRWDGTVAEPLSVEAGPLVTSQGGVVFSAGPGNVDAAVLGAGRGIGGGGVLATVTFQARGSGDPKVGIAKADARDATNQKVALTAGQPETPLATAFDLAAPNPFGSTTTLSFSLAKGGPVELAIFSVDGRRVKMLDAGSRAAGIYHFAWNGMDDGGHTVQPGLFFARLVTPEGHFTRTLVMVK